MLLISSYQPTEFLSTVHSKGVSEQYLVDPLVAELCDVLR